MTSDKGQEEKKMKEMNKVYLYGFIFESKQKKNDIFFCQCVIFE